MLSVLLPLLLYVYGLPWKFNHREIELPLVSITKIFKLLLPVSQVTSNIPLAKHKLLKLLANFGLNGYYLFIKLHGKFARMYSL
jgi:hypothetical protein